MSIPILKIKEMTDERWNELAQAAAYRALRAQGIEPTPTRIKAYYAAVRGALEERWVAVEGVPVYAASS